MDGGRACCRPNNRNADPCLPAGRLVVDGEREAQGFTRVEWHLYQYKTFSHFHVLPRAAWCGAEVSDQPPTPDPSSSFPSYMRQAMCVPNSLISPPHHTTTTPPLVGFEINATVDPWVLPVCGLEGEQPRAGYALTSHAASNPARHVGCGLLGCKWCNRPVRLVSVVARASCPCHTPLPSLLYAWPELLICPPF